MNLIEIKKEINTHNPTKLEQADMRVYDKVVHKKEKTFKDKLLLKYVWGEVGDYVYGQDEGVRG